MTDPADTLRRAPLFATLPPGDLARIAAFATTRRFRRRETIFREGDRAEGFYVVASGRVKVFKLSPEGKEQVLHIVDPGQSFAEAAIFEGGDYPAGAEALSDCELVQVPKKPFIALLDETPRMALRLLASLSRWLVRMTSLVEDLALRDVEARLCAYLLGEMEARGVPVRDGAVVELAVGKNVLASRIGTVPETLSRTLRKLQEEGTIRVRGRQIRVVRAGALAARPRE